MTRAAFKQRDVERLLKAGQRCGVPVRIRVDRLTGELVAEPAPAEGPVDRLQALAQPPADQPAQPSAAPTEAELDAELEAWSHKHGYG